MRFLALFGSSSAEPIAHWCCCWMRTNAHKTRTGATPVQSCLLYRCLIIINDSSDSHDYALPDGKNILLKPTRSLPRHRQGERFLKGPIPWIWLVRAANLPGRCLHVAMGLWTLAGIKKCRTIRLQRRVFEDLGVQRDARRRALNRLERARLISIARLPGRSLEVTLLECRNDNVIKTTPSTADTGPAPKVDPGRD